VCGPFTGCITRGANTPTYSAEAFHPNSPWHRQCAYSNGVYYYYDPSGGNSTYRGDAGIFQMIEGKTDALLTRTQSAHQMIATDDNLYYEAITQVNIRTKDLLDSERVYDSFFLDKKEDIIFCGNTNGIDKLPADDAGALPVDVYSLLPPQSTKDASSGYSIISDGIYDYGINNEAYYYGDVIIGIHNRETGELVYRDVENSSYEEYILFLNENEMIFTTYWKANELTKFSKNIGIQSFLTLPDSYYFYSNNIVIESGKFLALIQKTDSPHVIGYYNVPGKFHQADALISIDIETGEFEYIYETTKKNERIVGYAKDHVYLFKKGLKPFFFSRENPDAIYRVDLRTGEEGLFHAFEQASTNYTFEVCGEKIFVWGDKNNYNDHDFIGAYDLYGNLDGKVN
jgi:hypothetical protein